METPSEPVNYELSENDIASNAAFSFKEAPAEHDVCIYRLKTEDVEHLNYQRIAQRTQDELGQEVSWRLMSSNEVLIETGADIETDFILVLKREVKK